MSVETHHRGVGEGQRERGRGRKKERQAESERVSASEREKTQRERARERDRKKSNERERNGDRERERKRMRKQDVAYAETCRYCTMQQARGVRTVPANLQRIQVCILNPCCKCIARTYHKVLACGDKFIWIAFLQEPNRLVHGASMIPHAQACEHTVSRGCTRQQAVACTCRAPLHCCPSLLHLLTCIGNDILCGIGACRRRGACGCTH